MASLLESAGLATRVASIRTGLVAEPRGQGDEPRIAFRADIDALRVPDEKDVPYRSLRAGVRIACGTDAGTPFNPHGNTPLEIVRMVEWGLTPPQAMRAATSSAAELLRMPQVGTVEPGKAADLCLYEGDPIERIEVVLKPAMVMKAGEFVAGASL